MHKTTLYNIVSIFNISRPKPRIVVRAATEIGTEIYFLLNR